MTTDLGKLHLVIACLEIPSRFSLAARMEHAVKESGGTFVVPEHGDKHGSHLIEIGLHGVHATGMGTDEAIRNWLKAAEADRAGGEEPARIAQ